MTNQSVLSDQTDQGDWNKFDQNYSFMMFLNKLKWSQCLKVINKMIDINMNDLFKISNKFKWSHWVKVIIIMIEINMIKII